MNDTPKTIYPNRVEESIGMLRQHFKEDDIAGLIVVMNNMVETPQDLSLIDRLSEAFGELGIMQGAVLTYAPYVGILLADDPFGLAD